MVEEAGKWLGWMTHYRQGRLRDQMEETVGRGSALTRAHIQERFPINPPLLRVSISTTFMARPRLCRSTPVIGSMHMSISIRPTRPLRSCCNGLAMILAGFGPIG